MSERNLTENAGPPNDRRPAKVRKRRTAADAVEAGWHVQGPEPLGRRTVEDLPGGSSIGWCI